MFPDDIGALTVETVIPGSEASKYIEEGDILISINDEPIIKFVPLENILDQKFVFLYKSILFYLKYLV